MTPQEIRNLVKKAMKGNGEAQASLVSQNDFLTMKVNRQLGRLERHHFDYYAYDDIVAFTQTEYDTNRLLNSEKLEYDWYNIGRQMEFAEKFLKRESSTVEGQRAILERRIETFKEKEILPKDISRQRAKNFLKFLANEEVAQISENYGNSETVIEMMYGAYNKKKNTKHKMLSEFQKYLAGEETFDIAMERLGINIEDY